MVARDKYSQSGNKSAMGKRVSLLRNLLKYLLVLSFILPVSAFVSAAPAEADLRLCNKTGSRIGVAIGYKDQQGWATEGWWNVSEGACVELLKGPLISRFYYVHAIDYDTGGEWSGTAFMCTEDEEFTIRGINDCETRGYYRTGFLEVDTGAKETWTIQLIPTGQSG